MSTDSHSLTAAFKGQPRTVWVTAFAAVIAFMGIGLVDPILNTIREALGAPETKLTLLFGVYMGVQVVAMLLTGWSAYRFGPKRTLTTGLVCIVIAAGLSTFAGNIDQLIALRVIWGLGNALFIATALAFIVGQATGGQQGAILLYEAALGAGLAVGPLLGAVLGEWTWRAPFAGTALLMLAGAVLCAVMLPADGPREQRQPVKLLDPIKALKNRSLLINSIGSAFYTGALFTVIAWAPIAMGLRPIYAGMVFFGWGLLTALSGVFVGPRIASAIGARGGVLSAIGAYLVTMVLAAIGVVDHHVWLIGLAVVLSGIPSGVLNTLFTGVAMSAADDSTPRSVASAGYSFLRWMGAAASAVMVAYLAEWFGMAAPFWFAAGYCAVAVAALVLAGGSKPDEHTVDPEAVLVGAEEY
ncbi:MULTISPECIES: MFS transporter [Gordonia]|uniref:MFS transporter n=2 Tax=Gordonia TaxID=2053 RepID=A0ABN3H3Z5_9ACTN|nr:MULTISPECIES: MFS transporter [Gordonia]AUH67534.1 MFS transporter [Gordonia sp. YC-JH1]WFN92795.1 MFS transporter [Gordonia sihwensis]GAC61329.1 putative drug resistance transporter [Gordonia sihwensis NBRC 108236]